jgi:hypothetical protein
LKDDIKSDLTEIGWADMDRIHVSQDSDQWWDPLHMKMNPFGAHKLLETPLEARGLSFELLVLTIKFIQCRMLQKCGHDR